MNLDFAKVCGKHNAVYESYYKQIDPNATGAIEAMTAAKFLKKSGLSDVVLSRVWDMSDPNGRGFLDKPGFFVALKLVSLAQAGQVSNMNNIYIDTANPPKVGEVPKTMPTRIQSVPVSSGGVVNGDWSISVIDRLKYEQLFESLKPVGNMLPGNKVKGVLMESKLPMDTLGIIWDLADQDKDGNLDKHEFIVAMHLVYQTLQKRTVPNILPPELRKAGGGGVALPKPAPPHAAAAVPMPRGPSGEDFSDNGFVANFPKDIAPPAAIPPLPVAVPPMTRIPPVGAVSSQLLINTDPLIPIGAPPSVTANADWVVTPGELQRFEILFRDSDRDKDGLVSGLEVKNVFIQSGVPQKCLAHIWALCDTNQSGKLTIDQFALAMWMVERKRKGIDPPQVLTSNMIPPSMRDVMTGIDLQPQEQKPTYSSPELEMISKEIEELARERRALETEIAQKEADVRIKNGEVRSLQSELDTLSATLKQLENQRGEAQKRLDDLQVQVNKIRDQCQKQEETINEQEGELNEKRSELQKLKDDEDSLQKEYDENNRELTKLTQHLQNTQLQISSVRSMVTQIMETQRQMTDALLICRAAVDNQNAELVSEYQLKIEPDFDDARKTLEKEIEMSKVDPFSAKVVEINENKTINGFDGDPFSDKQTTISSTGFDDSFNTSATFNTGFEAFGGSSAFVQQHDPFGSDAFSGTGGTYNTHAVTPEPGKDDFGSDPFAALHAPTGQGQVLTPNAHKSGPPPRPESPSPALPPKKSKVPPPRPAPPRPNQGPMRSTQPNSDAFGSSTISGGGFADFADFDNKMQLTDISTALTSTGNTATLSSTLVDDISLFELGNNIKTTKIPSFSLKNAMPETLSATITETEPTPSSSLATSFTLTAARTITSTTPKNNKLSHSNTPTQQGGSICNAFASASEHSKNNNSNSTTEAFADNNNVVLKSFTSGPTDFKDDPFKDYRYEDPFNIKDPFSDDVDNVFSQPEKLFNDDLSAEDKHGKMFSVLEKPPTATPPLSQDILEEFDGFNLNSSATPSQHSTHSLTKQTQLVTPHLATALFVDKFGDFDAFSAKSNSPTMSSFQQKPPKSNNNNSPDDGNINVNKMNDSFFEAFNDDFAAKKSLETTTALDKQSSHKILDAFSDQNVAVKPKNITTALESKLFGVFNDNNFKDDFAKSNKNNNFNTCANNGKHPSNIALVDDFAKFDAFDAHNFSNDFATALNNSNNMNNTNAESAKGPSLSTLKKVQNPTMLTKNSNNVQHVEGRSAKMPVKFAADYSKPESFDNDLQEALKRSMLDN